MHIFSLLTNFLLKGVHIRQMNDNRPYVFSEANFKHKSLLKQLAQEASTLSSTKSLVVVNAIDKKFSVARQDIFVYTQTSKPSKNGRSGCQRF